MVFYKDLIDDCDGDGDTFWMMTSSGWVGVSIFIFIVVLFLILIVVDNIAWCRSSHTNFFSYDYCCFFCRSSLSTVTSSFPLIDLTFCSTAVSSPSAV